jgi:hypothetical protein
MNILTSRKQKDPFDQSDRDPWGPGAGKGDRPRNVSEQFKQNFEKIRWTPRSPQKPGKQVFRYGPQAAKKDRAFHIPLGRTGKVRLK